MNSTSDTQETPALSRRDFIDQSILELKQAFTDSLRQLHQPPQNSITRPPGALPESEFTLTCDPTCTKCKDACPKQAITQDMFGYPTIDPNQTACVMCTDVPCTSVCPTEALENLTHPSQIKLGTAIIELTTCTAFKGSGCKECFQTCPLPNQAIQLEQNLPEIVSEHCTGCGICVEACPTQDAISIQPLSSLQTSPPKVDTISSNI